MAVELSLAVVGTTFSSISAAIRLAQLSFAIHDVPATAHTFIRLVDRVEKDVEHALMCRIDCEAVLDDCPSSYEEWISDSINDTLRALNTLGEVLLGGRQREPSPNRIKNSTALPPTPVPLGQNQSDTIRDSLSERFMFVLKDHSKLKDQERSLQYSHSTLLAAISAMHTMIFKGEGARFAPGRVTRAASRPKYSSSQRPSFENLSRSGGLLDRDDAAPPYSLNDPLSVGTGEAGLQTAKQNLAKLQSLRAERDRR